jgi:hypothetical protein
MQAVYIHIPHTNQVSRLRNFTAVLWLQFMVQIMLLPTLNVVNSYTSTFRSIVQCPIWFVLEFFDIVLYRYVVEDFSE